MKREIVPGVPYYYSENPPAFRTRFIIYMRDGNRMIFKGYMLPPAFSEDMREKGILSQSSSIYRIPNYPESKKDDMKAACQKENVDFIELGFPDLGVENDAVRYHMSRLYRKPIDFDPLADWRLVKSVLKPSL